MTRKIIAFLFLEIFFIVSCGIDEDIQLSTSDYLIFGHFYGECIGEGCIEIYKLEENRLLEDTRDKYPNAQHFYEGEFVELSQQQFEGTKDLIDYFPTGLLKESGNVIGQPDAGDWGGVYIEYNINGVRKFWLIDMKKENVPEKYHQFIDKVNEKIELLIQG